MNTWIKIFDWSEPEWAPHEWDCLVRICVYICMFAWLLGPTSYCQFQMSVFTWMHSFEIHSKWCIHDPRYLSESEGEGFCQTVVSVCEISRKHNSIYNLIIHMTTSHSCSYLNYTMRRQAAHCSLTYQTKGWNHFSNHAWTVLKMYLMIWV